MSVKYVLCFLPPMYLVLLPLKVGLYQLLWRCWVCLWVTVRTYICSNGCEVYYFLYQHLFIYTNRHNSIAFGYTFTDGFENWEHFTFLLRPCRGMIALRRYINCPCYYYYFYSSPNLHSCDVISMTAWAYELRPWRSSSLQLKARNKAPLRKGTDLEGSKEALYNIEKLLRNY